MNAASAAHFDRQYQRHLKHLKLKGLQTKTIEAYSRAIRRIGKRFDGRIDDLTEPAGVAPRANRARVTGQGRRLLHCRPATNQTDAVTARHPQ